MLIFISVIGILVGVVLFAIDAYKRYNESLRAEEIALESATDALNN